MLPEIQVMVIPHGAQRYETVGDWYYKHPESLQVRVSELGNENYEFLVTIHELIEAHLCRQRGIAEEDVTAFDIKYEAERDPENRGSEPGDSPRAPYRKEHQFATRIERLIAQELGIDWAAYEEAVNAL